MQTSYDLTRSFSIIFRKELQITYKQATKGDHTKFLASPNSTLKIIKATQTVKCFNQLKEFFLVIQFLVEDLLR